MTVVTDELKTKTLNPKEIFENFVGNTCLCGKFKGYKASFCRDCYYKLPIEMRNALYQSFYNGYLEAFTKSAKFLNL